MRIHLLVLDEVVDLGLSGILDTFAIANQLAAVSGESAPRFDLRMTGLRDQARTHHGLMVPTERPERLPAPDLALVPGLSTTARDLDRLLARSDVAEACAQLRAWSAAGVAIGAACSGTFVLGASSLLDGHRATTTWWLAPLFRERFPAVELDDSRMVVESGRFVTAGAVLAHVDLALRVVRRQSPSLAALAARYLAVEPHASQAAFAIPDHLAHDDPVVARFEKWVRLHLGERFSLEAAARAAGTSERTLARRVRHVLGRSPVSYVQAVRVERAIHLLQTSDRNVDEIAAEVGYCDGVTLRTLLRRETGRTVRELRARG